MVVANGAPRANLFQRSILYTTNTLSLRTHIKIRVVFTSFYFYFVLIQTFVQSLSFNHK